MRIGAARGERAEACARCGGARDPCTRFQSPLQSKEERNLGRKVQGGRIDMTTIVSTGTTPRPRSHAVADESDAVAVAARLQKSERPNSAEQPSGRTLFQTIFFRRNVCRKIFANKFFGEKLSPKNMSANLFSPKFLAEKCFKKNF